MSFLVHFKALSWHVFIFLTWQTINTNNKIKKKVSLKMCKLFLLVVVIIVVVVIIIIIVYLMLFRVHFKALYVTYWQSVNANKNNEKVTINNKNLLLLLLLNSKCIVSVPFIPVDATQVWNVTLNDSLYHQETRESRWKIESVQASPWPSECRAGPVGESAAL